MAPTKMIKRKNGFPWLLLACISTVIYIIWRIVFTIPVGYGVFSFLAGIALILAETAEALEMIGNCRGASSPQEPELPSVPDSWFPDVDVLIATHNEPVNILYKTVNGCKQLKYPDRDKVHIYLCDDGCRPEVKRLAKEMEVGYFGLEENREAKAGNLNHALSRTHSPLVATFDADMIPVSAFLMKTVPYFYLPCMEKDKEGCRKKRRMEKIGFIQTPQSFYNPDLFQFNLKAERKAPNEQDYFFRHVNVRRNRTNTPIYAGSNTVISRGALEAVGGIRTGTVTEDFATGIAIQAEGFACYAIGQPLANGLSPTDVKSLIRQRQRWARGCVHTLKSREFLLGKLPFAGKLSYLHCLLYWWSFARRFIYLTAPILYTVFGVRLADCAWWELALIWLPNHLIGAKAVKQAFRGTRSRSWSNLVDTAIFPYLILSVAAETIGIREKRFAVTEKQKKLGRNSNVKYASVHLLLIAGSSWGLLRCLGGMSLDTSFWQSSIVIYWLAANLYYLAMAVRFFLGRRNQRREERIPAREKVLLTSLGESAGGMTTDISESGMSVVTEPNFTLENGQELEVSLCQGDYRARLKGKVARGLREGDRRRYGISFPNIPEEEKKMYYGFLFDRDHTRSRRVTEEPVWRLRIAGKR